MMKEQEEQKAQDLQEQNESIENMAEGNKEDNNVVDDLNLQIVKLQDELKELKEKFFRASADFENIKKRMQKDKEISLEYANEKFAKELLPVIDTLEEASKVDVGDNELAIKIKEGIDQCLGMFHKCFEKFGITKVDTDCGFNPEFHNAISTVQSDELNSGDIVNVYQKGYKYKDRILRASMVVIAK